MIWLGVALTGSLGALARASFVHVMQRHGPERRRGLPLGILAVNVSGSLLLGVLIGAGVHGDAYKLAGVGLLGSYTTFSTWMLDSAERPPRIAVLNIVLSAGGGLAAVALGRALG